MVLTLRWCHVMNDLLSLFKRMNGHNEQNVWPKTGSKPDNILTWLLVVWCWISCSQGSGTKYLARVLKRWKINHYKLLRMKLFCFISRFPTLDFKIRIIDLPDFCLSCRRINDLLNELRPNSCLVQPKIRVKETTECVSSDKWGRQHAIMNECSFYTIGK